MSSSENYIKVLINFGSENYNDKVKRQIYAAFKNSKMGGGEKEKFKKKKKHEEEDERIRAELKAEEQKKAQSKKKQKDTGSNDRSLDNSEDLNGRPDHVPDQKEIEKLVQMDTIKDLK